MMHESEKFFYVFSYEAVIELCVSKHSIFKGKNHLLKLIVTSAGK